MERILLLTLIAATAASLGLADLVKQSPPVAPPVSHLLAFEGLLAACGAKGVP
jgi:hypothetical protein